ncbi:hypothetical protein [Algoriphagus hitonicola]|uniref:TolB-like 6-blade propeller-like n=1 Tax=Algoriphagus hitonicola TaxID=435880 RepID=A0A1I2UD92_9BACT|nr:hypothetical protein [Algoriphagus hitonicola]SFG75114.1 hypothetical protein SAMN04487988_107184 [Algoriphagus hitonicola]
MKNFVCFFILCLIGCTKYEITEPEDFILESGKIYFHDSIALDEKGSSFNFVFNPKIYQDSLLVFGDGSFSTIHLYNLKSGSKIQMYSYLDDINYPLPKTGFSNSFIKSDSLKLLNFMTNKIYIFSIGSDFLNDIKLQVPENSTRLNFQPFFEQINDYYYISQRMDLPIKKSFLEGKMISIYAKDGSYIKSFGNYPKYYSEGNLALVKGENVIYKNDKIYIINSVGIPILKEYSLDGDLLNFYELESEFFNPELNYFQNSPFDSSPMNQILTLATDRNKNDGIFYLSYVNFSEENPEKPEDFFRLMIMKVDLKNRVIKESELVGPWHYYELRTLIPQVNQDTLSILIRGTDENLYLKKVTFD